MFLNTLSPAPGRIKKANASVVVSVVALVKLLAVATKGKSLALVVVFVQVLKVVKCHYKNACLSMALPHEFLA